MKQILYADVILALHIPFSYTYRVPEVLSGKIKKGQRVVVQVRNRIYSAVVVNIKDESQLNMAYGTFKYILDIVEQEPVLLDYQIQFYKWIADYYIAYIGDVLSAALPSAFRLKSETTVAISPYFNSDISNLSEEELKIVEIVSDKEKVKLEDITLDSDKKNVLKIIQRLIRKDVLITDEELLDRYRPKRETYLSFNEQLKQTDNLKQLLSDLDKSKRTQPQAEIILKFISLEKTAGEVKLSDLENSNCNINTVKTLIKKGILVKQSKEISRLKLNDKSFEPSSIILNDRQQKVFDGIISEWNDIPISLIHGVTGSGKTEIYIKLIDYVIAQGGQVLYLLPEIAVTTQLLSRLEKYFGNKAVLYNSKFSTMQRAEVWKRMLSDKDNFSVVLGSRSAVFLPFKNLKLVIIDEEHDTSFKQTEPVPHYNGRDCALYLAKMFNAKAILGSATPNVETYKLALEGKYQLTELTEQYFDVPLSNIELVDMRQQIREKRVQGVFSERLIEKIEIALQNKNQVIIFQNRRGYAPHIECNVCGYVPKCPNCDVSLVLHKQRQDMECHYCGYHTQVESSCPQCHSHSLRLVGAGTEKIEEELQTFFPDAKIVRMDLDSTRTKDAYINILNDFALHKTDILCGTQIVTKGLNFDNVALVGVIGVDTMLHYPDFRASERTFQILTQVSGRAGRKGRQGKVLIQTFEPDNIVMQSVIRRDYMQMFKTQLQERRLMNFPPYCRMIKLTLQHKDKDFIVAKSREYAINLKRIFASRLFGPQEPVIARIKNLYAMEIWLKIEKNISYAQAKQRLIRYNEEFLSIKTNSNIRISVDVDPV